MKQIEKLYSALKALGTKLPRRGREPVFLGKRIKHPVFIFSASLSAIGTGFLLIYTDAVTYDLNRSFVRQTPTVEVFPAERGTFRPAISVHGHIVPKREVELQPQVHGRITRISDHLREDNLVEAGEFLLKIDDARYRRDIASNEIRLEETEKALAQILDAQKTARMEYEQRGTKLPPHEEALLLKEPEVAAITKKMNQARKHLAQARKNLTRTSLRAPFDARILETNARVGVWAGKTTTLAKLANLETYHLLVPISQRHLLHIPARGDAYGDERIEISKKTDDGISFRSGKMHSIEEENTEEGTKHFARIEIEDPLTRSERNRGRQPVHLGESWEAQIRGKPIESVIRIPAGSIRSGDAIWILSKASRLDLREADIVLKDSAYAYIKAGIEEGESVITSDLLRPKVGMKLRTKSLSVEEPAASPTDSPE